VAVATFRLPTDIEALERDGTVARLRAEAMAGDRLAELVTAVLPTPLEGPVGAPVPVWRHRVVARARREGGTVHRVRGVVPGEHATYRPRGRRNRKGGQT
jgi:hypothetical protein